MATFSVDLDAGPVPGGEEIADVAGRLSDAFGAHNLLDAAVGARLDLRTIGCTMVGIEAASVEEALHVVIGALVEACGLAGLTVLPILRAEVISPNAAAVA